MLDFKRIGGEIVSSPLNENFRRMRNNISIANTNLFFPDTNGVVDTITDMYNIPTPEDAQCCYVVSSGELYRYSKTDDDWHKIADFGNTFRQGFLNSGAVIFGDYIKIKEGSKTILSMPKMLVYFKNKPGDNKYLKGMYLIEAKDFDTAPYLKGGNSYSIILNNENKYQLITGMPQQDDPNQIVLGVVLASKDNQLLPDFVFTLPDIAYTADRGQFYLHKGQAEGFSLIGNKNKNTTVNRDPGLYYDEGVNVLIGNTDNYPIDNDNGSNYNLRSFTGQDPVDKLYYILPENGLVNPIVESQGIVFDKMYNKNSHALEDTQAGTYTIQQHLVTPNGKNIIIYGTEAYNSYQDAEYNLNNIISTTINFPYVEASRLIIKHTEDQEPFDSGNPQHFKSYSLSRLSQIGTISPRFADNEFEIYSGKSTDITPATIKFDLNELEAENYNNKYNLVVGPFATTRDLFGLNKKYITDSIIRDVQSSREENRIANGEGYQLADDKDLTYLKDRVKEIEKELWNTKVEGKEIYEQSARYRLYRLEQTSDGHTTTLQDHETRIQGNENNKVNKTTTVNGYTLGDNQNKEESKAITLYTGDITEGQGKGSKSNLWYTDGRVSANTDVVNAKNHIETISSEDAATTHIKVNPHNLSTDDLNILVNTDKLFVDRNEKSRISSTNLPDNTKQAIADLAAKSMESIKIDKIKGNSAKPTGIITPVGNVTGIKLYDDGLNISLDTDNKTLILEATERDNSMRKDEYAPSSVANPQALKGYVDKAIISNEAYNIEGMSAAGISKYYGTNSDGTAGTYSLPTYVSTEPSGESVSIDKIILEPQVDSIQEKHLVPDLRNKINNNYHMIYNNGRLMSSEINEFSFGDNLTVQVAGHKAVINASGTGGSGGVSNFVNLSDVNVTYSGNKGKMLVVNNDETGVMVANLPPLNQFMLESVYVDPKYTDRVKRASLADVATVARSTDNAAKVGNKSVDDTRNDANSLWTASKIISNTSSQISKEGVQTYSGSSLPASSLGKNGDIYILLN